jgi:photosystem II stability/assembly factor-like uncharacterized protein
MNHSRGRAAGLILSFALVLLSPGLSAAQSWSPAGPTGGDVRSLAADPRDPQVVYLGTANGTLYRSQDGGRRWRPTRPGFPSRGMSLDDLVVDPQGVLYVGFWEVRGSGGGVARSTDGGTTFEVLAGIAGQGVRALAIASSQPSLIVAGTARGVFRSPDAGQTWERISPEGDAEIRNVDSIAIDPGEPDTIYAGTWHLPWKTTDGGRNWKSIHAGMIDDSDVMTLTFDRRSPRIVYASACSGIYRSADAAERWAKVRGIPGSSRRTRAFAQHASRFDTFYAGTTEGLWTTDEAGASWRLLTSRQLVVNAILVQADGTLLVGSEGAGVLRSSDGGLAWASSNEGFSERFVSRIVFDPASGRVLAGILGDRQHGGVLSAPRPGGPWSRLGDGLEGREVLSLAVAGDEVLAGTDDGLFVSVSHCGGWRRLPTVIAGTDVHPRVRDLAVVSDGVVLAATSAGLLRSADGGERWERKVLGLGGSVEALAVAGSGLTLAATPLGFFKSADGGATWAAVSAGAPDGRVQNLAFLPGSDRVVFASSSRGLMRSADQGRTWEHRGGGLPLLDITGLAMDPNGRTIFVSEFSEGGLWQSLDAGDTWSRFPTTGLSSERVWVLALDVRAPGHLLAAAAAGGVHEWQVALPGGAAGAQ